MDTSKEIGKIPAEQADNTTLIRNNGMHYRRYYKARSERGKRTARLRWDADRARRDAEAPERVRALAGTKV